ncbi:MAG TPA: RHS repeat-associated core domain-containing protein, partial [Duganella sp.]|uniref:RHS repeat domain-containing protein n=1 Tax=Duganella sp. TaxID=1904440 RepID=UPI002ED116DC
NRTQLAYGGQTFFNTISPASNQLLKTSGPAASKINVYDAAGNLTSDGTITYIYNTRGRLQAAQSGSVTGTYRHNGLGQRALKIVKIGSSAKSLNETTQFVYDELGQLMGEYDSSGTPIEEIIYLGNISIAIFKNGKSGEPTNSGVYYIHNDQINTPRLITNSADNHIVWRWDLADPFGASSPDDMSQERSRFSYNLRFPGQYYDKEINLHHNYYRDYDAQTGRFIQSDPIGLGGGLNTYDYVQGNPISFTDPFGLQVDMNLHAPGTAAYRYGQLIPPPAGSFSINGHGNAWWLVGPDGEGIQPEKLADMISKHPKYSPDKKILFYICELGKGDYPQRVTNILGNNSAAPNEQIFTYSGGKDPVIAAPSTKYPGTPDMGKLGEWIEFRKSTDCNCKK